MLERFFVWGEEQAAVIREAFPDQAYKLRVTGNPRQDLYHPALRPLYADAVQKIRRQYGPFILVNSNFGSVNHARRPYTGLEKSEADIYALAAYSGHKPEYIAFRYRVFRSFYELVPRLAEAFPNHRILIRPHPSERLEAWEMLAKSHQNVVVRYDHELIPWLLAAEAIIHNGCTTAIEAAMLEKPVIEFRAIQNEQWENPQPKAISIPARTTENVITLLRQPRLFEMNRQAVERPLRRMIAFWNEGFACERIAKELEEVLYQPKIHHPSRKLLWAMAKCRFRVIEKYVVGRLMPWKSANPAYIDKKFPPMSLEEIRARICQLADLIKLPCPYVEELGDRIWRISPTKEDRK